MKAMLLEAKTDLTAFADFPERHWKKIQSANPLERVNQEIKRRVDVVQIFRTLLDEWAYTSDAERTAALADFLHTSNHHRCHTALGGHPPISRVNNAAGQYT